MKFLIIKTSALGDIVQSFPALSYLRAKFPSAKIDWVVEKPFAEMVQAHPDVDTVYPIDTQAWRKKIWGEGTLSQIGHLRKIWKAEQYDAVFDLQGNIKSGLLLLLVNAKKKVGFGSKTVKELPNILFTNQRFNPPTSINIRSDYLYLIQSFFSDTSSFQDPRKLLRIQPEQVKRIAELLTNPILDGKTKVMVCPGSAWPNKQLEPQVLTDFLIELQNYLHCSFLFVWGSAEEKKNAQQLHSLFPDRSVCIDRLPLPVLQNLMERMDYVIAMDSLPLHMAGTTSTATFSIFGPSLAAKFKPEGERHAAMQGSCPYGRSFVKRCPILRSCPTGSCIRGLSGKTVFEAFQRAFPKN